MKKKEFEEKEKKCPSQEKKGVVLKDETKVWESGVPFQKVIQHEALSNNKALENLLHFEQPSYLFMCQGSLTCSSSESKT